jgi:hypothetical protein
MVVINGLQNNLPHINVMQQPSFRPSFVRNPKTCTYTNVCLRTDAHANCTNVRAKPLSNICGIQTYYDSCSSKNLKENEEWFELSELYYVNIRICEVNLLTKRMNIIVQAILVRSHSFLPWIGEISFVLAGKLVSKVFVMRLRQISTWTTAILISISRGFLHAFHRNILHKRLLPNLFQFNTQPPSYCFMFCILRCGERRKTSHQSVVSLQLKITCLTNVIQPTLLCMARTG